METFHKTSHTGTAGSMTRAWKRIVKVVLVFILVASVIQVLFDPLSGFLGLSQSLEAWLGLPAARTRWESQNITHYTFDIQGYVPLACLFGGNIEVKDGIVVRTGPRSDGLLSPGLPSLKEPSLCNLQTYTMPMLFDELERQSLLSVSEISFDPEYGFTSRFGIGSPGGHGILNPRVSDCCIGFSIENFRILEK